MPEEPFFPSILYFNSNAGEKKSREIDGLLSLRSKFEDCIFPGVLWKKKLISMPVPEADTYMGLELPSCFWMSQCVKKVKDWEVLQSGKSV